MRINDYVILISCTDLICHEEIKLLVNNKNYIFKNYFYLFNKCVRMPCGLWIETCGFDFYFEFHIKQNIIISLFLFLILDSSVAFDFTQSYIAILLFHKRNLFSFHREDFSRFIHRFNKRKAKWIRYENDFCHLMFNRNLIKGQKVNSNCSWKIIIIHITINTSVDNN